MLAQTKSVVDQKKGHVLGKPENTRMWCGGVTSITTKVHNEQTHNCSQAKQPNNTAAAVDQECPTGRNVSTREAKNQINASLGKGVHPKRSNDALTVTETIDRSHCSRHTAEQKLFSRASSNP